MSERSEQPISTGSAEDFMPARRSLAAIRRAVDGCRGCDLYRDATQAVFGEGPGRARMMFVGEQPGDREDIQGRPFVGPSGRLLWKLVQAAGIDRRDVYVTNAVKHFRFQRRGKKRIHTKPTHYQTRACRPWLIAELELVEPEVLVLLGATAAQSVMGFDFRLTSHRAERLLTPYAASTFATVHPSALLRIQDDDERRRARADYIEELRKFAGYLGAH